MRSRTMISIFTTKKSMFVISWFAIFSLNAQVENNDRAQGYNANIYAEAFVFESEQADKGRVDMFVQVPYSEINFIKDEDLYFGSFEVSISVINSEKQQVWQKNQLVELRIKDFSQTVSNRFSSIKQFSTDILPGKYELLVQIMDQESKKTAKLRKQLYVRSFNADSLSLSDLMLVHRLNIVDNRNNIVPNLTGVLSSESNEFYLFFEVYNSSRSDSIKMLCKFINPKEEVAAKYTKIELPAENRTQVVWKIDSLNLATNNYLITVEAENIASGSSKPKRSSVVSKTCVVKMKNLPAAVTSIDKATDQLIYIAKESEIDFIRSAENADEKLTRFLEFWKKRDPDPKTSNNELMEEYYKRVAYADKNFAAYIEGWRTDRGMVFIRFGPPQNLERHPFNSNSKPYEIWYYYEQNREFVFVDETGFGDYRLRYPETDLWGRVR